MCMRDQKQKRKRFSFIAVVFAFSFFTGKVGQIRNQSLRKIANEKNNTMKQS